MARFVALGLSLWLCASPAMTRAQDQFVLLDTTYTATAQNTMDSHYRVMPRAGTPANWRTPVDYASGSAHARLEVLEKPSSKQTLYNICFEATPSYACMGYPPAYTAPGVYDFSFAFSTFYQYSSVDWSKGVRTVALILKDENGTKMQASPDFYPSKTRLTLTIVRPGAKYVPPALDASDAGVMLDAAAPVDAGAMRDARVDASDAMLGAEASEPPTPALDAGQSRDAGQGPDAAGAVLDAGTIAVRPSPDAGSALPDAGAGAVAADAGVAASPAATEPDPEDDDQGGCSVAPGERSASGVAASLLGLALVLARRRRGQRARKTSARA